MEYSHDQIKMLSGRKVRDGPSLPAKDLAINDTWVNQKQVDWRIKGGVGMVKDQIACGSCWTFGTIGCLEARINIQMMKKNKAHSLLSFSE